MDKNFVKCCKLFDNMTEEEISAIMEGLHTTVIPTGKSVISEHGHGDNLYVIVKGSVEITKDLAESEEDTVAQLKVLEPGEFFGEMSLLDNEPRSANVISRDNVEVLVIPKDRFLLIAYSNPKVMFNLIRTLSWRLRDTNQKFVETVERLIAQNRLMAIGMAASKIIHDIKTPLTVIVLTAQMLENLYPDGKRFTDSIVSQTMAVNQMVLEILDFAKGNVTPINPQKVVLAQFLQDINDTFGQTLTGQNIELIIQNRVTQDVWFDESKIRRVLVNLMKNSSEAMKEKGVIRLDALMEDEHLVLIVSDNGTGIPERIKANLFSPFQSEGKSHGTGLGLAITRKLIHEHKGTIEYRPNEPQGTIFILKLPQQDMK
jgi:signal transduction histidine kinase